MQLATFQNKMIPLLEQHMRHYLAQFTENKTLQVAMQYSLEASRKTDQTAFDHVDPAKA